MKGPTSPFPQRPASESAQDDTLRDNRGHRPGSPRAAHSYLFLALEADRPLAGAARYALDGIEEVVIARGPERSATRGQGEGGSRLELRLPGRSLSSVHARLRRTPAGWVLEDAGSTNGSFVNGARIERALLGPGRVAEVGHCFLLVSEFTGEAGASPSDLDSRQIASLPAGFPTLVPPIAEELGELERIARSRISVVLCGETGTGKELLARAVHTLSRCRGAFVAVNCGALTASLAESQLFGHMRGAFTGAVTDGLGYLRAAEGGTLLLDEVEDLQPTAQVALLRALQEREVVPVGSARPQKIDLRFIATTPRPLRELVASGDFRADLFSRLSGFTHLTSPLRSRIEDLGLLVAALLTRMGVTPGDNPTLSPEVGLRLLRHGWPLNVRELEQSLMRGWALARGGVIDVDQLRLAEPPSEGPAATVVPPGPVLSPEDQQLRGRIIEALTAAGGNVAEVARHMGKARMQLHRWMKRFAIDPGSYRR
jgi:DNA-binding NtrC family response regulator